MHTATTQLDKTPLSTTQVWNHKQYHPLATNSLCRFVNTEMLLWNWNCNVYLAFESSHDKTHACIHTHTHTHVHTKTVDMKCPVCKEILVDPCTLQCGHTFCQLCLACIVLKTSEPPSSRSCPLCKQPWQVIPDINRAFKWVCMHLF